MEAMPGISLYSYLYPKPAKPVCLSYYLFNKIKEEGAGSEGEGGRQQGVGGRGTNMYTHVSKGKKQ
jgi:hypothetical protein